MSTREKRELDKLLLARLIARGKSHDEPVGCVYWNSQLQSFFIESPSGRYPVRMNIGEGPVADFFRQFQEVNRKSAYWPDRLKEDSEYPEDKNAQSVQSR